VPGLNLRPPGSAESALRPLPEDTAPRRPGRADQRVRAGGM